MTLYTVAEVAAVLKLSRSKVYEMIAQGKLPVYRIEGAVRVSEDDLLEYLRGCHEVRQKPARKQALRLKYLSL